MQLPSYPRLKQVVGALVPWGVGLLLILTAVDEWATPTSWLPLAASIALSVIQGAALHWRRRRPDAVMLVVLAAGLVYQLLVPEIVLPIAGFFAVGSLAAARPPRVSLLGLAGLLALSATNFLTTTVGDAVFTMGLAVGAWALGEAARSRNVAIEEATLRAAMDEQARIARELHDVIAHSVSVIVVQAGAADHVFDTKPEEARAALRAIEATARDAQQELHWLLASRRDEERRAFGPAPGLDRIEELVGSLRAAGLRVSVRREGASRTLPGGVDRCAYRIVQEALTNTIRHARASRADVTIRFLPDALELSVVDDGRGVAGPSDGGGYGIAGMRERAAMLGGTLEAGPVTGGGFGVRARVPLESERA